MEVQGSNEAVEAHGSKLTGRELRMRGSGQEVQGWEVQGRGFRVGFEVPSGFSLKVPQGWVWVQVEAWCVSPGSEVRGRKLEVPWKFRVGIVLVQGGKFRSWEFQGVKFRVGIPGLEIRGGKFGVGGSGVRFFIVGNSW